jgi:uncharacterized membrane protein
MSEYDRYSMSELSPQDAVHARVRTFRSKPRSAEIYIALLILVPLLVVLHRIWAVQVILILLLLSLPGLLLLRALRIPGRVVAHFPAFVPCASLTVLLSTGLVLDLVGPVLGLSAPLRTLPILVSIEAVCVALLLIAKSAGPDVELPRPTLKNPIFLIAPLVLPLIAILGAQRLNNGHSSMVALAATLLCAAVLIGAIFYASRLEVSLLTMILFSAGLALMYSFSLRGALVYGFDISTEYQRLSETVSTGVWHPTHHSDAYGAMLSLTVMPAEMHFISGVSPLMIFKIVYPLFGALFPIEIFAIAKRVLSKTWSFIAAAILIAQSGFMEEFPALARQEVALAFFGALVAVMLYRPPRRASQWGLATLFALSMVVSHYSTTYLAITVFGAAIILQWVASWFRRIPRFTATLLVGFTISLLGAIVWYGPVTQSATGLSAFSQTLSSQGLDLLPNQTPGESFIAAYLNSGQQTMTASQYESAVHSQYVLDRNLITPLPDAGLAKYSLKDDSTPVPPTRLAPIRSGIDLVSLLFQQILNLLGTIGALLLVCRKRVQPVARLVGLLGLGAALFLVLIKLSGTLATFYNSERAIIQALGVFSITFCWMLERIAWRWGGQRNAVLWVTALSLTAFMFNSSGLQGVVLGGGATSNLANSGEDYERFVRTAQELSSASWLASEVRPGQFLYADRYAQLPLQSMTSLGGSVNQNITPLTLNQNAWVYASSSNILDGRARVDFNNYLVTYEFPIGFLDQNFNVVYSDGASEVFYR